MLFHNNAVKKEYSRNVQIELYNPVACSIPWEYKKRSEKKTSPQRPIKSPSFLLFFVKKSIIGSNRQVQTRICKKSFSIQLGFNQKQKNFSRNEIRWLLVFVPNENAQYAIWFCSKYIQCLFHNSNVFQFRNRFLGQKLLLRNPNSIGHLNEENPYIRVKFSVDKGFGEFTQKEYD